MAFSWSALVQRILSLTGWVGGDVTARPGWRNRDGGEIKPYVDLARSTDQTVVTSWMGSSLLDTASTTERVSMNIDDMQLYWRLDGHTPVPCSQEQYIQESRRRHQTIEHQGEDPWRVAYDVLEIDRIVMTVSTVFLAMNHNLSLNPEEDSRPVLFETLVSGGIMDEDMDRYSTWDEALEGHQDMLEEIQMQYAEREAMELTKACKKAKGVVELRQKRKIRWRKKE